MSNKYTGKAVVATWTPAGGTALTISPKSKKITVDAKSKDIDATTQEDAVLNATFYLSGPAERQVTIEFLDSTAAGESLYHSMPETQQGALVISPQGSGTGLPVDTYANCTITSRSIDYPTDGEGPVAGKITIRAGVLTST